MKLRSLVQGVDEGLTEFANRTSRLIKDSWPEVPKATLEEMAVDTFLLRCRNREAVWNLKFVDSVSLSGAINEIGFQQQNQEFYCVKEVRAESFEDRDN